MCYAWQLNLQNHLSTLGPQMNWLLEDRLRLLRHYPFRLYLLHVFITIAGGGMSYILVTWHVFALSDSIHTVIINALMFWVPSVLFSPVIGWLVDRYSRKAVLILTNAFRAVAFIALGWVMLSHQSIEWCYLLTFTNGISFAFGLPAFSAFTRELVQDKDLLIANTTVDVVFELANILGMGLTGVLVLSLSFSTGIILVGAFIVVGIGLLALIHNKELIPYEKEPCTHFITDWKHAYQSLKNDRLMLWLSVLSTILFIQFMIAPILVTPFLKHILHAGAPLFSAIEVACSIGMVLGALAIPVLAKSIGWKKCLLIAISTIGVMLVAFSLNHSKPVAAIIYFILGFCFTAWSLVISRAQERMPKAQQGRIQTTLNTFSSLIILILYTIMQYSTKNASILHAYWYCTSFAVLGLLVLWVIHRMTKTSKDNTPAPTDG